MNRLRLSPESAYYGPTEYSDMSEKEFLMLTLRPDLSSRGDRNRLDRRHHRRHHPHVGNMIRYERAAGIPPKVNWRSKGVVTSVKSQGNCGACWAYSTVECVESMVAIKTGALKSLSVQEVKILFY